MRTTGTIVRGVRAPVIRKGDDLAAIVIDSVMRCVEGEKITLNDRDIVGITEAVVARAQGNYATVDEIARDVSAKFGTDTIGVIFPILSRNRFAVCLRGIARAMKKIYLMFSYPADEVGNHLIDDDLLDRMAVDPWTDVLDEKRYRELFGRVLHPFTGVDYVDYYRNLIVECGCKVEILFSNKAETILGYSRDVLTCDIHTRMRNKRILKAAGAGKVLGLDDIMTSGIAGSGYNDKFGLLGSNKATEETVKLFPRDCQSFVDDVAVRLKDKSGKKIEVLVYGDGAFKDPVGKIWELADPVVSPGYTHGLNGTPNELKLKYLADNQFAGLCGAELESAIKEYIRKKDHDLKGSMESQGTTPRQLTDLIGSLCDLTSGSGDKGTPIILIQGYFDNFSK